MNIRIGLGNSAKTHRLRLTSPSTFGLVCLAMPTDKIWEQTTHPVDCPDCDSIESAESFVRRMLEDVFEQDVTTEHVREVARRVLGAVKGGQKVAVAASEVYYNVLWAPIENGVLPALSHLYVGGSKTVVCGLDRRDCWETVRGLYRLRDFQQLSDACLECVRCAD